MQPVRHYTEYIKQAKAAEEEGALDEAAKLYEKAIKQNPMLEQPYNRLMVIYRKNKQYKDELRVLNKALDLYITHHDKKKEAFTSSKKIKQLSNAILKSVSQGKGAYQNEYPQPIPKWLTRKKVVEKKLK